MSTDRFARDRYILYRIVLYAWSPAGCQNLCMRTYVCVSCQNPVCLKSTLSRSRSRDGYFNALQSVHQCCTYIWLLNHSHGLDMISLAKT